VTAKNIIEQIKALPEEERVKVFELIQKIEDENIPESFWEGLVDCAEGRVVDMDVALNQPPPK
jgi:hypothetical protein